MGEFSDEFFEQGQSPREIRQHAINSDLRIVSFPTIGCLTKGYTLIVPISNSREPQSLAELSLDEFGKISLLIEAYRKRLKHLCFGSVIVAEHGDSSSRQGGQTCACEREAHIHLIPTDSPIAITSFLQRKGGDHDHYVESWGELHPLLPKSPYVLMSSYPEAFFLWTDPLKLAKMGSQAIRKATASVLGIPDKYNWKKFSFSENMELTKAGVGRNLDLFVEAAEREVRFE